jgi:hypothetical protein
VRPEAGCATHHGMKSLFLFLCALSLAGAAVGGLTFGPRAGIEERRFQATVEEVAARRPPGGKPSAEDERELGDLARRVATAKASFAGSLGGGLMLAALFALLAKQRGRTQAAPTDDARP